MHPFQFKWYFIVVIVVNVCRYATFIDIESISRIGKLIEFNEFETENKKRKRNHYHLFERKRKN